jgi:hypothetical protein
MRSRSLAKWLVVGALAAFAVMFFASLAAADATAVQGQNGSIGGAAASGPAAGGNAAVLGAGPAAGAALGSSQSQQMGDNSVIVNQSSSAKSGDAVAGSQVTGVVGGGTVMNSNSSFGSAAVSGPAIASNVAVANAGPLTGSLGGFASTSQAGGNSVIVNQESKAMSGDALAGSQTTGAVGGGATIMNSNSSFGNFAASGLACASFVCGGGNVLFAGAGPSAVQAGILGSATATQLGDNDVVISQSSIAQTGDSLAGAQVTGTVGSDDMRVANQNSTAGNVAVSGFAFATNVAAVNAGPGVASIGLLLTTANASQAGSNNVVLAQESGAITGDALAGSQVTGLVSAETGNLTVLNQQSSDFDFAFSGWAFANNFAPIAAGPKTIAVGGPLNSASTGQFGDNNVTELQSAKATTGDALAGSGVTGGVGGSDVTVMSSNSSRVNLAITGPSFATNFGPALVGPGALSVTGGILDLANARVQQFGSNSADISQEAAAATGDALSGSQVAGVVTDPGNVRIAQQNSSFLSASFSAPAVALNIAPAVAGPMAGAVSAMTILGNSNAAVQQAGSNHAGVAQSVASTTGDALAGSQVAGVVSAFGDVTVMNSNSSVASLGISGPAIGVNFSPAIAGPLAGAASVLSLLGNASANVNQLGDNSIDVAQNLVSATGDAVAGSQVTGAVADGAVVIADQNSSLGSLALSGPSVSFNWFFGQAGPSAGALSALIGVSTATASQAGSNHLGFLQDLKSTSGDAVAGSQVEGAVGAIFGAITHSNFAVGAAALSGIVTGNNATGGSLSPSAGAVGLLGNANTQQFGNSGLAGAQGLDLASGDAITSSQVSGSVGSVGVPFRAGLDARGFLPEASGSLGFIA